MISFMLSLLWDILATHVQLGCHEMHSRLSFDELQVQLTSLVGGRYVKFSLICNVVGFGDKGDSCL